MGEEGHIYCNPESFGLRVFAETRNEAMDYAFSMFVVWQDAAGQLFWAEDAGCSCPDPFENITEIEELNTIIGADGLEAFFNALTAWGDHNRTDNYGDPCTVDTTKVRRKVREYMTR